MNQTTKAEAFRALHKTGGILVLPNAWDAASAALMADAGARAVATSSAAVAWAHGYADGDHLPLDVLTRAIGEAAKATGETPLTADIEGGYTDDLGQLAETVAAVIEAGAVGINLEDGRRDPELHARKVAAAREAADRTGVPLFINARIDVYLKGLAEGQTAFRETLSRAERYREAGADGIFVPGPAEEDLISRLASEIRLPLNIMGWRTTPKAERLQALGVRRLSSATSPFRAAYNPLRKAIADFLESGDADALAGLGEGFPNLNERFAAKS